MRWLYVAVIVVFTIVAVVFAAQNLEVVTVSFIRVNVRTPLALLIVGMYLLGAVTGTGLLALFFRSVEGAKRRSADRP